MSDDYVLPASRWAREQNVREHNTKVELRRAGRRLERARRSIASLRATLEMERARAAEAASVLESLRDLAAAVEERGLMMTAGFIDLHVSVALEKLGRGR